MGLTVVTVGIDGLSEIPNGWDAETASRQERRSSMYTAHITLDGDEHAPRRARAALRRMFRERHSLGRPGGDVLADAELLLSELVTNAVLHARAARTVVDVAVDDVAVVIGVSDDEPDVDPVARKEHQPGAAGGFGLRIVEQLACRWGIEPTDDGKRVWFELPLRRSERAEDRQRTDLAS